MTYKEYYTRVTALREQYEADCQALANEYVRSKAKHHVGEIVKVGNAHYRIACCVALTISLANEPIATYYGKRVRKDGQPMASRPLYFGEDDIKQ